MTASEMQSESMFHYGFGYEAMKRVKICEKCGAPASVHRLFCKECGAFLTRKSLYDKYKARHKVCGKCKTILPDAAEYCTQCGTKQNNKEQNNKEREAT